MLHQIWSKSIIMTVYFDRCYSEKKSTHITCYIRRTNITIYERFIGDSSLQIGFATPVTDYMLLSRLLIKSVNFLFCFIGIMHRIIYQVSDIRIFHDESFITIYSHDSMLVPINSIRHSFLKQMFHQ